MGHLFMLTRQHLQNLVRTGVGSLPSSRERRQARLANALGLGLFLASAPYLVLFTYWELEPLLLALVVACVGYVSSLPLNKVGWHHAAKLIPLVSLLGILTFVCSAMGSGLGIEVFLLMIPAWAFNLFDVRRHPWTLASLIISSGVAFLLLVREAIAPAVRIATDELPKTDFASAASATAFLLLTWVLWLSYRGNQATEDKLVSVVAALRTEVAERKRSQALANAARADAEMASRAKSEFLAIMSHELRTPLNGVVGSADLLSETALDQEQHGLLRLIQSSSRFLLSLVSNVLDFASMESGKVHLTAKNFDLVELLEETTASFCNAANEKGIALWLDIAPDVPRYIHGDDARIRQLIGNLIDNALKFTDRGRVLVSTHAELDKHERVKLTVEVHDSGIGVAPEHREAIFERFSQQDTALSRRNTGVGLGLTICRLLARTMGGEVRVSEGDTCGSVFVVELVVERAHAAKVDSSKIPTVAFDMRCVVCCRSPEQRLSVVHALTRLGVAVVERLDEAHRVHAVISDLPDAGISMEAHVKSLARTYGIASNAVLLLSPRGHTVSPGTSLPEPLRLETLVAALPSERDLKESDRVPVSTKQRSSERIDLTGARILVAEDNLINQKVLLSMLRKLGVNADAVMDGQQAVDAFAQGSWVAVLMDIQMPVMDGLAATEKIRKLEADRGMAPVPVIAVSANAMPADIERGFASGVTAYLTKPLQLATLQETLSQYLLISTNDKAATRH